MSAKHTYQIAFRGDIIFTFTSVYDSMHVVVGYPKPTSGIKVLDRYKTAPVAINTAKGLIARYPGNDHSAHSAFVVPVTPGLTEVSACPIVWAEQHLTGVSA